MPFLQTNGTNGHSNGYTSNNYSSEFASGHGIDYSNGYSSDLSNGFTNGYSKTHTKVYSSDHINGHQKGHSTATIGAGLLDESIQASWSALETTLLINANNPTIVGVWDLRKPSTVETSKRVRIIGENESLGSDGDRRKRANDSNITPSGQYKAICKLYMAYANGADEYIGTGWLVGNDIIATAGHCVFDWSGKGGFLKYIKCYFGYDGSRSTGIYRYGVSVACPTEYLKAPSQAHDLGFIRLDSPVEGVPLITFSDTPTQETAELGVVGYPGDRDFGEYLYEHWTTVNVDLEKTGNVLSYQIDTMPGETGAPILRRLPGGRIDAIGVHIAGGFPNAGSVIGQVGNRFDEYLLALDVKNGHKSSLATVLGPLTSSPVQGFKMISISPSDSKPVPFKPEHTKVMSVIDPWRETERISTERRDVETMLRNLFGRQDQEQARKSVIRGTLTQYPDALKITPLLESERANAIDYERAVARARAQEDVQTVFFVDFPAQLEGDALQQQRAMKNSIQAWQAWSSANCEGKVQQQVDAGKLPSDSKGQFARGAYRAKIFDYLFRNSSWFARTPDQNKSKHLEVQKVEFHAEILNAILEGYSVPSSVYADLEKVLRQISDGIRLSSESSSDPQQYWVMLTKYNYQPITQEVQPVVRIISFQVGQQARHYSSNKASYDSVSFDLNFTQSQGHYNHDLFSKIRPKIDERLVQQGMELIQRNVVEVEIPA